MSSFAARYNIVSVVSSLSRSRELSDRLAAFGFLSYSIAKLLCFSVERRSPRQHRNLSSLNSRRPSFLM